MTDLVLVFVIGLLSSVHCVGMCGGFVLAIAGMHDRARGLNVHQALYYTGKTFTYTLLGVLAGAFGSAAAALFSGFQDLLSVALGIALVLVGLSLAGVLRRIRPTSRLAQLNVIPRVLARLLKRPSHASTLGLGAMNGLLPCALVYGMLVKAASTGNILEAALTMAVFGISTVPALYMVAVTGFLARPVWRTRLSRAGGVLVVILGLMTIVRGTPVAGALLHSGHGNAVHVEQQSVGSTQEMPAHHAPPHGHQHK